MASKGSKSSKQSEGKRIYAVSDDCEKCKEQCIRGQKYLTRMRKVHKGNGVVCRRLVG